MTFAGYQGMPASFARGFVSPEPRLALRYQLTPRVAHQRRGGALRAAAGSDRLFARLRQSEHPPRARHAVRRRRRGRALAGIDRRGRPLLEEPARSGRPGPKPRRSAARQRRHRPRLRRRGPRSPEPGQAPLRVARLHAVAERAEGPSGSELVSVRVRPDEHPHRDAQLLPAARVRGGRALSLRDRGSVHARHRLVLRLGLRQATRRSPAPPTARASAPSASSICASTRSSPSTAGASPSISTSRTCCAPTIPRRLATTTTSRSRIPSPGCRCCPFWGSGGTSDVAVADFGLRVQRRLRPSGARRMPELLRSTGQLRRRAARARTSRRSPRRWRRARARR